MAETRTDDRDTRIVVGLAGGRGEWAARLSRWAMSATADVEFLRCLSATEVRAVLGAGRPAGVLLLDTAVIDRDLIGLAHRFGVPSVAVHAGGPPVDWQDLGCVAILREPVEPADVLDLLEAIEAQPPPPTPLRAPRSVDLDGPPDPGVLVAVTGAGGSGATTVAMLLAHGLDRNPADRRSHGHQTVLLDATETDGVALYHDLDPDGSGIAELLELHRRDGADPAEIRALGRRVPARPYLVILGDPLGAAGTTSEATATSVLDGLGRTFANVVVDAGSLHPTVPDTPTSLRAAAVARADVVVAVGRSGLHGVHRLAETIDHVRRLCGPTPNVVTVCTAAPRSPVERRAVATSLGLGRGGVVFLPPIGRLERIHRDVVALPGAVAESLTQPIRTMVGPAPPVVRAGPVPR